MWAATLTGMPSIRFASLADAPAIARIHAESWRRHYRGMYADRYLDGDLFSDRLAAWSEKLARDASRYFTLLAEDGDGPIGFAHVSLDGDPAHGALLDNLHVTHAAQGRGAGTRLMDRVAQLVKERRPGAQLFLWVLAGNEAARDFYIRRGGLLADRQPSAAPGGDPRNLHGSPERVRVKWHDPAVLIAASERS